jgi:biopolymer transport protein TolR
MQGVGRQRRRRKLKAEINVVPYIDVMLVLLIIFMVTAPLLNLGVDIQLPQSKAKSVQNDKEPAVVSVDKDGKLYLTLGPTKREPVEPQVLIA